MEFHGIDSQGEIFIQRAASLSAWAASDQGRLLYTQDTASLYYGTNTQWMPLAGFGAGTRMWFHQDTAPVGWSIVAGLGDRLLAVKGGSQDYDIAGGGQGGTWVQPSHLHDINHYHYQKWSSEPWGGHEYQSARHFWDFKNHLWHYNGQRVNVSLPCDIDQNLTPNSGGSATSSAYRPKANVGIVAEKD